MVERHSPLKPAYHAGEHGNLSAGAGVRLSEVTPASIVQVAAWHGQERAAIAAIRSVTGIALPDGAGGGVAGETVSAFGFAPGKFTVVGDDPALARSLLAAIPIETGTVTDLSHGRTAIRIAGARAEWVLAKFFAIDFSPPAFPIGAARSTNHHDIFAQIQRGGADQFDIYVFRSFARSFWKSLCHASEEVGYEVE
jgi:heterotetrameric sarcosine oxidase gamma subunit